MGSTALKNEILTGQLAGRPKYMTRQRADELFLEAMAWWCSNAC